MLRMARSLPKQRAGVQRMPPNGAGGALCRPLTHRVAGRSARDWPTNGGPRRSRGGSPATAAGRTSVGGSRLSVARPPARPQQQTGLGAGSVRGTRGTVRTAAPAGLGTLVVVRRQVVDAHLWSQDRESLGTDLPSAQRRSEPLVHDAPGSSNLLPPPALILLPADALLDSRRARTQPSRYARRR